ncbi:BRO-N domain-containing protein [Escherichia coli]
MGFEPVPQGITLIRERDIYELIIHSRRKDAERFRDWLFGDVLPSIRKYGYYGKKPEAQNVDDITAHVKGLICDGASAEQVMNVVSGFAADSETVGKVGSRLLTQRKRDKKQVKRLVEEVAERFQLKLFE